MSGNKNNRGPADNLWVRIVCGALGVLMILGIVVMFAQSATYSIAKETEYTEVTEYSDSQISVGLCYGDTAVQSYTVESEGGLVLSNSSAKEIFVTDSTSIAVCIDKPLTYIGDKVQTSTTNGVKISGEYHIQIASFAFNTGNSGGNIDNPVFIKPLPDNGTSSKQEKYTKDNISSYIKMLKDSDVLMTYSDTVYPAYVDGKYYIRFGQFDSKEEAQSVLNMVSRSLTLDAQIVDSNSSAYTILNNFTQKVIYEISVSDSELHVSSISNSSVTDGNGNDYCGDFEFIRENKNNGRIKVINTISLEEYICAIIPFEISATYQQEAAKAFSVILRTDTVKKLGRHESEKFDVCTSNHCHRYSGMSEYDVLNSAVMATAGKVLTYNGELINAVYSTSCGKSTVSAQAALGSDEYPYLVSQSTEWENCDEWTVELSANTLRSILQSASFNEIQGSITNIDVIRSFESSGYVESITFIDVFDNTVTIDGSENIRNVFGSYLPCANFSVNASDLVNGNFTFTGTGSGNGIGFSILGANSLAESGINYIEILETYYPGSQI